MDPASIAALVGTCLSIARNAGGFITGITDLRDRYNRVELNTQALTAQTETMRLAADRLREWLNGHGGLLRKKERRSIRRSIEACELLIQTLNSAAGNTTNEKRQKSLKDKIKMLWQQTQINEYAVGLNHQAVALNFHLQTLKLPDSAARRETLRRPESKAILEKGISSASSISSSVSWVSSAISSRSESSSSETSRAGSGYQFTPRPVSKTQPGRPKAPTQGSAGLLTADNLARLSFDGTPSASTAPRAPTRGQNPQTHQVPKKGNVKASEPSSSSSSDSTTSRGNGSKRESTPRPGGRRGDAASSKSVRSSFNGTMNRTWGSARQGHPRRSQDYGTGHGSDSELSDGAESILTIQTELDDMSRNLVVAAPWGNELDNMERTLLNLGGLRETIRRVGMKARTSRAQLSELDDTIHGVFVEVEQALRSRENQPIRGTISLLQAARMGDAAKTAELLRNGADISERNERGETALHIAVQRSELRVVQVLTREGADLEARDRDGNTALLAVEFSFLSVQVDLTMECLLQARSQVEARAADGSTPLHRAANKCNLALVDLLLFFGADVNSTKGPQRLTPLHLSSSAIGTLKPAVIKRLLDGGADAQAASTHGDKPLDLALKSLLVRERTLGELEPAQGLLASKIFTPCSCFRAAVEAISVLLEHNAALNLNAASRGAVAQSFLFRELRNFADLPMRHAREQFQELRLSILLDSDSNIYRAVRIFRNAVVEKYVPAPVRPEVPRDRGRPLRGSGSSSHRSGSSSSVETVRGEAALSKLWKRR